MTCPRYVDANQSLLQVETCPRGYGRATTQNCDLVQLSYVNITHYHTIVLHATHQRNQTKVKQEVT